MSKQGLLNDSNVLNKYCIAGMQMKDQRYCVCLLKFTSCCLLALSRLSSKK